MTTAASGPPKKSLRQLGFLALRTLGIGYVIIVVAVYLLQRRMLYMPSAESALPQSADPTLREIEYTTSDGLVHKAWYWPGAKPETLLLLHGNAGSRVHRLGWLEILRPLGYGLLLIDYRGYGGNPGTPTEDGLYRDAEAALAWLKANTTGRVVYFGESLGSGVAVELARRAPPAALILQSAFDSVANIAQRVYFFLPVGLLLKDRFDNDKKIAAVAAPMLFIHGTQDEIIPITAGRRLFAAARGDVEWRELAGADHNYLAYSHTEEYVRAIREFLTSRLAAK
ncbi:MAG: alpha/beta hydrolase [Planctomycetota bacterium]